MIKHVARKQMNEVNQLGTHHVPYTSDTSTFLIRMYSMNRSPPRLVEYKTSRKGAKQFMASKLHWTNCKTMHILIQAANNLDIKFKRN
jgi:hypothetical protein